MLEKISSCASIVLLVLLFILNQPIICSKTEIIHSFFNLVSSAVNSTVSPVAPPP